TTGTKENVRIQSNLHAALALRESVLQVGGVVDVAVAIRRSDTALFPFAVAQHHTAVARHLIECVRIVKSDIGHFAVASGASEVGMEGGRCGEWAYGPDIDEFVGGVVLPGRTGSVGAHAEFLSALLRDSVGVDACKQAHIARHALRIFAACRVPGGSVGTHET